MNARERFIATIRYEKVDRPFRWEAPAIWPATIKQWHAQGLPGDITCSNITNSEVYDYFGMDKLVWLPFPGGWITDPYCPMFETKVLADNGDTLTIVDSDGITKNVKKVDADTSMPQFLRFPVQNRADYRNNLKWRLDYTSPERFPRNWSALVKEYAARTYPIGMFVIGPFGHLRNLLGDDRLMYSFYDDPELVREIMTNWTAFYRGFLRLVAKDVVPDFIMVWEDMCYKSGPLISPATFEAFMSPGLAEVIDVARSLGITGLIVDNDGDCHRMLPVYLKCGANAFYPFEVQAGMNVVNLREQYGQEFAIIGGLDKRVLPVSDEAIRAEVARVVPFMRQQGGYIPMLDHSVPTNVTLNQFRYFVNHLRSIENYET